MIFATVGTTRFDALVEAIDKIALQLDEEVVVQSGDSKYTPRNCKYFNFDNDLFAYYKKANIVIAHGGAGTIFEVLNLGKKLIAVENPNTLGGHQGDLLGKLSQEGLLTWCKDLNKIEQCIKDAKKQVMKQYVSPECKIGKMIVEFLA